MTDPNALSTENIIGTIGAGVVIAFVMLREYFKTRKAPATTQNGDRVIPGITIADMRPILELATEQGKTTAACVRVAEALEAMLELSKERAADEEIVRRAEIMAQQMIKQLPAAKRPTR